MSEADDNNSNDAQCNSTDGRNYSGGTPSISLSEMDDVRNITYIDTPSILAGIVAAEEIVVTQDYSDNDTSGSEQYMDEFVMWKMENRSPRYDDNEGDRIASPEISDNSYDEPPIANSHDELPPLYDVTHYARPRPVLRGTCRICTYYLSGPNEVVRPNYYSTVTEVPTTTTSSEVVIRRANQENITRAQMIYSDCSYPRRDHSMLTTVYKGPRMTTAVTRGIAPPNEEITSTNEETALTNEEIARRENILTNYNTTADAVT
eukprot:XP_016659197.1 PREDICTED: uncharacterized protein LOC107883528 [Acyrthosiphon pisum]